MKREVIVDIICLLFILLFVYAAVNKLLDVEKFKVQIGQSPLLTVHASWVAWAIPLGEIFISLMLSVSRLRIIGLFASLSLMIVFTAYIIAILNFSEHVPCSCGGVLEKLGWTEHLIFNLGFVLLALVGITLLSGKRQNTEVIVS